MRMANDAATLDGRAPGRRKATDGNRYTNGRESASAFPVNATDREVNHRSIPRESRVDGSTLRRADRKPTNTTGDET